MRVSVMFVRLCFMFVCGTDRPRPPSQSHLLRLSYKYTRDSKRIQEKSATQRQRPEWELEVWRAGKKGLQGGE